MLDRPDKHIECVVLGARGVRPNPTNHQSLHELFCYIWFSHLSFLQPYSFPPLTSDAGYEISYRDNRSVSNVDIGSSNSRYTIRGLQTNVTYQIRIRAQFHYSEFCITRSYRRAQWSSYARTTTRDTGAQRVLAIELPCTHAACRGYLMR